jgi:hypothetical protein
MDAQRQFRLGGRDDEDGSLNPKHVNLSLNDPAEAAPVPG